MKNKIAVALNMLSPYWHPIFHSLGERGWEISILVGAENEPDRLYSKYDYSQYNFKVIQCKNFLIDMRKFTSKTQFLHLQYGLMSELMKIKPDVILSNELGPRTLFGMAYGALFSIPVIAWVCASSYTERNNSSIREFVRTQLLKYVSCVCTNATEGENYLHRQLYVPSSKIFRTPYAVNVEEYAHNVQQANLIAPPLREQLHLNAFVFLYVGQMIPRKGLWQLANSFVRLSDDEKKKCSLICVGGNFPEDLKLLLQSHKVHFISVPFVQPSDIFQYYAVANAFVFPSLEDEWGIVLNEAASAGLPLLASMFAASTTDLVNDSVNGFRCNPFDEHNTTTLLSKLIAMEKQEIQEMGRESFRIVKRFDAVSTIEQLDAAFRYALFSTSSTRQQSM
jgi:glycosyltransferase involved in cell wall biosynthesis